MVQRGPGAPAYWRPFVLDMMHTRVTQRATKGKIPSENLRLCAASGIMRKTQKQWLVYVGDSFMYLKLNPWMYEAIPSVHNGVCVVAEVCTCEKSVRNMYQSVRFCRQIWGRNSIWQHGRVFYPKISNGENELFQYTGWMNQWMGFDIPATPQGHIKTCA